MNVTKVLIFGISGQLGRVFQSIFSSRSDFNLIGLGHSQADLSHTESLEKILDFHQPQVVINAAAYTDVTKAESEEALATKVNALAPAIMAKWCRIHGSILF